MLIKEEVKDVLQEMVNMGMGRAAVAFSEILDCEVNLSYPTLKIFTITQLKQYILDIDTDCIVIRQSVRGGFDGDGIISFPLKEGKTLLNLLLDDPESIDYNFGIMEQDTLLEVGNTLINAIFGSMSDMADVETRFGMPEIIKSDSLVPIEDASAENIYCIGQVDFSIKETVFSGMLVFVLIYQEIEQVVQKMLHTIMG